jgi:Tfp pilus assembly protein PilV
MSLMKNQQQGFAVIEGLLILVVVAVIGFGGYKVISANKAVDNAHSSISTTQPQPVSANKAKTIPAVNKAADLNKVDQALNDLNPTDNSGDTAQLDRQLDAF